LNFVFNYGCLPGAAMSPLDASAPRASRAVPLASLAPGTHAVIESVESSTPIGRRLADLGFLPRTPIQVLRRAPLGDPVAYELRGYRLCLRRSEALRVLVVPTDPAPPAAS
jgi:ferrous iron transport protein A